MYRVPIICALAVVICTLAGCNAFEFAKPTSSAKDFVAEGMDHLWNGEYADAELSFTKALEQDSLNAEARWGRAKARFRASGFTAISLVTEVSNLNTGSQVVGELPFMSTEWPAERVTVLYGAMRGVLQDLEFIYDGRAVTQEFRSGDVALDYAAALSVTGVLTLRDTNLDGVIDANDINLTPYFDSEQNLQIGTQQAIDQWNAMTDEQQQAFVNEIVGYLGEGSRILIEQIANSQGIDPEELDRVIAEIRNDLLNNPVWQ